MDIFSYEILSNNYKESFESIFSYDILSNDFNKSYVQIEIYEDILKICENCYEKLLEYDIYSNDANIQKYSNLYIGNCNSLFILNKKLLTSFLNINKNAYSLKLATDLRSLHDPNILMCFKELKYLESTIKLCNYYEHHPHYIDSKYFINYNNFILQNKNTLETVICCNVLNDFTPCFHHLSKLDNLFLSLCVMNGIFDNNFFSVIKSICCKTLVLRLFVSDFPFYTNKYEQLINSIIFSVIINAKIKNFKIILFLNNKKKYNVDTSYIENVVNDSKLKLFVCVLNKEKQIKFQQKKFKFTYSSFIDLYIY